MLHPQTNVAGSWYQSQSAEDTKSVYTGKGCVHSISAINGNAAVRYLWVFDNTAASGTVLAGPFPIGINGSFTVQFPTGIPFSTGLFVAASTTPKTYTATGGTDCLFTIGYAKRSQMG